MNDLETTEFLKDFYQGENTDFVEEDDAEHFIAVSCRKILYR